MDAHLPTLSPAGLQRFRELRRDAIDAVTARFFAEHGAVYATLGPHAQDACREDLGYHLDFLQPVLELGLLAPMVDYLQWLTGVLAARDIPASHVALSLEWLAQFFAARMDARDAEFVAAALRSANEKHQQGNASPLTAVYARLSAPSSECQAFEDALLAGDRQRAAAIVERSMAAGKGLVETEMHIIQPALYHIGQRWQNNEVSVAQEHLATAIAQSVMTLGLMKSRPAQPNGRKVLLACVEGNHHVVGLHMVSDAFQLAGWEVQYLGANVPTGALVRQVAEWRAHLVGISVSFAHQLRGVKQAMSRLQDTLGDERPPVIIGGLAMNQFDTLASRMGAEGWSPDAASAVQLGNALAGSPE